MAGMGRTSGTGLLGCGASRRRWMQIERGDVGDERIGVRIIGVA
jgi:hypothetical protein